MKLAVLGDSDTTGQRLIRHALRQGYDIAMLSPRTPISFHHEHLTLITGSAQNEDDLAATLKDTHAVIGLADVAYTATSLGALVACMHAYGIRRLIITTPITGLGTAASQRNIASMLQQTSLDWTVVHSASPKLLDTNFLQDDPNFTVAAKDFARFLVGQITDVTHLQKAIMLQN